MKQVHEILKNKIDETGPCKTEKWINATWETEKWMNAKWKTVTNG
jgi:hypothetical protein